jgi:MFS transporter, DHA2 family, multidrug resistance protein
VTTAALRTAPPPPRPGPGAPSAPAGRADVAEYGLRRILIVAGVMLAALMQTLDSTITNVALPTIQGNLGASQDEATWVVTSYAIAAIVIIPLTPWLQNRFGRKTYFVTSIIGFTLASIACGASESLSFLIVSRVVQGAFGGGLLATSQSILRDTFPPKQLGISQGIFALGAVMGPALGPPLGGYLVDNATWNWCFDINIAPGIIAAILLAMLLRDPDKAHASPVDFVGLGLLAAGLGSLQYVLTEGEPNYWFADPIIDLVTGICIASLIAFALWELHGTTSPVVDLRALRNRSIWTGTVLSFALGAALLGSTYTLPQLTQGVLGFTPTRSGELFIIRAVPILLCTIPVVRLATKVDTRILVGSGFILIALANAMQGFVTVGQAEFSSFVPALILSGIGISILFIPLTVAVLGGTTPAEGPKASAFLNLSLQLGGSVAIAILAVFLDQREEFHSTVLASQMNHANPLVQQFLAGGGSVAGLAKLVAQQSAIISYADATFLIAAVAALCTPLVLLLRKPKPPAGPVHIEAG